MTVDAVSGNRSMRQLTFILWLALAPAVLQAGEFNKTRSIGDPAPAWKDLPGVDGKTHSLSDLKDKEFVVVCFTCNSCACSVEYEDRIIDFAKKYETKATFVAINVNTIADDKMDAMKKKAEKKGFKFAYLYDESQKIAKEYGAVYTPEFFVLNNQRKIVYMGSMDDKTNPAMVKEKYLEAALDALLKGEKPAKAETIAARGCRIRYKRDREEE
jgi:peroxiredoxin